MGEGILKNAATRQRFACDFLSRTFRVCFSFQVQDITDMFAGPMNLHDSFSNCLSLLIVRCLLAGQNLFGTVSGMTTTPLQSFQTASAGCYYQGTQVFTHRLSFPKANRRLQRSKIPSPQKAKCDLVLFSSTCGLHWLTISRGSNAGKSSAFGIFLVKPFQCWSISKAFWRILCQGQISYP